MARRIAVTSLALVLAGLAVRASAVWADADPASDTLLIQDAFFPYAPSTPQPLQRALVHALSEIRTAGVALRVAVIRSQIDLGGIPELFGQPARYARFLDVELSEHGAPPLLVVMPDGMAAEHAGPGAAQALREVPVQADDGSAGLVRTAVLEVERIAADDGHPIAPVALTTGGGGSTPIAPVAIGGVLLLALVGGGLWRLQARREHVLTVRRDPAG